MRNKIKNYKIIVSFSLSFKTLQKRIQVMRKLLSSDYWSYIHSVSGKKTFSEVAKL